MKRILITLLIALTLLLILAPTALAKGRVEYIIRVFDMPKSGTIDIMIRDKSYLLSSWNKEHIVSEEHLDYTLGPYYPVYPFSKDITYVLKYCDIKPNPYMELKVGFGGNNHPEDFVVMAEANDNIVTSSALSHGSGVIIANLEYTDTALKPTTKRPISVWTVLFSLMPGILVLFATQFGISYFMKIFEHKVMLKVISVTTFVLFLLMLQPLLKGDNPSMITIFIIWPPITVSQYIAYKKLFIKSYPIKQLANYTVVSSTLGYLLFLAVNQLI